VRFQVLTAASMKFTIVFWDVLPSKIIVDRRFRGTCCLHPWWWMPVHPRRQFWTSISNLIYNIFWECHEPSIYLILQAMCSLWRMTQNKQVTVIELWKEQSTKFCLWACINIGKLPQYWQITRITFITACIVREWSMAVHKKTHVRSASGTTVALVV
jgi:hypothetical protein